MKLVKLLTYYDYTVCVHCNLTPPDNSYHTKTENIKFYKLHLVDITYEEFPSIICNTFKYLKEREVHMGFVLPKSELKKQLMSSLQHVFRTGQRTSGHPALSGSNRTLNKL
jgi:hypothetical protein